MIFGLVLYLIFIIFVLTIIAALVYRLHIPHPISTIFVIGIVIVSPVLLTYVYITYIIPTPEVVVPDLTYLTTEEADVRLTVFGLKGHISEYAYEKLVPEGRIISQRPEAGRRVKIGRIITLKVSIGRRKVSVPNLVGRFLSQVEVVLNEAGLKVGRKTEETSEQFESGVVIKQIPPPEEKVDLGSYVDIVVAQNPYMKVIKMPNVVGKSLEEASSTLADLKLYKIVFYQKTDLFPENQVLSQTPLEGEEITTGSTVRLTVSARP